MKGKCLIEFEKWYESEEAQDQLKSWLVAYGIFKDLPDSMQYCVIEDFFDSVGIKIGVVPSKETWASHPNIKVHYKVISVGFIVDEYRFLSRKEARKQAIEKATEIYNER